MNITVNKITDKNLSESIGIWNETVKEGSAFPQLETLSERSGKTFFEEQSYSGAAKDNDTGEIVGVYILHPNNVGRCGHICNASYAVKKNKRGNHIGEILVRDCMKQAKELGFKILQFNAVVRSNIPALRLYERMGFIKLGVIPGGFLNINGVYEDIIPHYIIL